MKKKSIIIKKPKILVGCPVYSGKKYITPYWIENVKNLNYSNFDIFVVDNSKPSEYFEKVFENQGIKILKSPYSKNPFERLAKARRLLNNYAMENGYDYLLSIEQDVIVPTNLIEDLLKHGKKVIGAPYIVSSHTNERRRLVDYVISASKLNVEYNTLNGIGVNEWYLSQEIQGKGLIQVKSCSLGCTLISTKILKKIPVRVDLSIARADDSYFFHDCFNLKIPVFLDTSFLWKIHHIKRLGGELQVGKELKNKNE